MTAHSGIPAELASVPGIRFVDHIAIAVKQGELDAAVKAYELLGFRELHREEVFGKDQVRESLIQIGDSKNLIQLVEPLNDSSPVQKMIDKNGKAGFAHIGLRVDNAQAAFDELKARGFNIVDAAPRPGSRGTTVFFIHPKSRADYAFGMLIEIVEDPQDKK